MTLRLFLTIVLSISTVQANPVRVGIFDISFYGIEETLSDHISDDLIITPHDLYSPHGAAVASLIAHPQFGGSPHAKLSLMSTGITLEDFQKGIRLAKEQDVRLVNVSLLMRRPEIIEIINQSYEDDGIIYVVSAGNDAARTGRQLQEHYHDLKAIIVSCLDFDDSLPDFAQLDQTVHLLARCGRRNMPTFIKDPFVGPRIHLFGMTSSAAPQVTAWLATKLAKNQHLRLDDIIELINKRHTERFLHKGISYPVLTP